MAKRLKLVVAVLTTGNWEQWHRRPCFQALACELVLFSVGASAIPIRLLTNLAIPGWATFTTLIGLMGFVQSLVLAVISEYVAVIFDEIKARPLFLVRNEFANGKTVRETTWTKTPPK